MVDDLLAVPGALDKHFAIHGARASEVRVYMGHKVYLAEGGPHHDAAGMKLHDDDEWMRAGYYLSVWGVMNGKAVWGRPAYFKLSHNAELTHEARRAARLNAAMADAEDYVMTGVRAGLLKNKSVLAFA